VLDLRFDPALADGVHERGIVALVLVGITAGEARDGAVDGSR